MIWQVIIMKTFCNVNLMRFSAKNSSARRPLKHDETLIIPISPDERLYPIIDDWEKKENATNVSGHLLTQDAFLNVII